MNTRHHPGEYTRWPTEGEMYDPKDRIFENELIRNFLRHEDRTILVAPKGMGKTLLLKKKRQRLEEDRTGILILPHNSEADYISLPGTLDGSIAAKLGDRTFWTDLWTASFVTSILMSLEPEEIVQDTLLGWRDAYPATIARAIDDWAESGRSHRGLMPSQIASAFLTGSSSVFHDFQRKVSNDLVQFCINHVRHGTYIFLDSFDQELRKMSENVFSDFQRDVWCSGQQGLMKAAWSLNRRNKHIKVFTSVRQEAWSDFYDEDRQAILGHLQFLSYTREDLKGMADVLFSENEKRDGLKDFLGFDKLENKGMDEPVFDYVFRHSIGRPRGIAVLGDRLHGQFDPTAEPERRIRDFRRVVNESAPQDLVENYLRSEMRPFLSDLIDEERLNFIWRNIPSNILTMEDMTRIRKRYAEHFGFQENDCHPFCELMNVGLLGHVAEEIDCGKTQKFRKPEEFSWDIGRILPGQVYYILHPALTHIVRRNNAQFRTNRKIICGSDQEWSERADRDFDDDVMRVFISYSSKDTRLVDRVTAALSEYFDTHGVSHQFWRDRWSLVAGRGLQDSLEQGVRSADLVLLFFTRQAAASGWAEGEWRMAKTEEMRNGNVKLVPITNDPKIAGQQDGFLGEKHFHLIASNKKTFGAGAFETSIAKLAEDLVANLREGRPSFQSPGPV